MRSLMPMKLINASVHRFEKMCQEEKKGLGQSGSWTEEERRREKELKRIHGSAPNLGPQCRGDVKRDERRLKI